MRVQPMEDPKIVSLAMLLQRSRPLSAAAFIPIPSGTSEPSSTFDRISKKRKLNPSDGNHSSGLDCQIDVFEVNLPSRILSSLRHPSFLIGTVRLTDSSSRNPGCFNSDCLTFSDGAAKLCCSVLGLDGKILGKRIRVLAWNFIPLKCNGGVLEIIRWDLVEPADNVDFRSSPLLSLSSSCHNRCQPAVCGKLVAISPFVVVPCTVQSRKYRPKAEHGITDGGNLKGFLADIMTCNCASCYSGAFQEKSHHSFTKPVILYFCGSTSSWRSVMSNLLGYIVCIRDVKKKLVSTGREKSYEMFVTRDRAALYLFQLPSETISCRKIRISGKGEMGRYNGTVTGIHMQGMVIELDKKVWLLLTDHLLAPPHSLRIGSIVALSNIHFVHTTFPWVKVLLLGACFKTSLSVKSFSPLEAQCNYRSLNQSLLGKFIESLTFSAKFWVLLVISSFRKKFSGTLSEKEILGSKHTEGFVHMYCRSCLPSCAFRTRHQLFIEFCEHDCWNSGGETDTGKLKLVVPLTNFIGSCEVLWINLLSQMQNDTDITDIETHDAALSCEGKPHGQLTRRFISSEDLGVILMGTLQICPSSGRLQMIDATGSIDIVVPDLLSNSDLNKIYEVKDYVLILEGLPVPLDSIESLKCDIFSCRSIFNHVISKKKKFQHTSYVLFYLRNATCLSSAFNFLHKDRHVSFNKNAGAKFQLLLVTHKYPAVQSIQDDHLIGLRSSLFAEAKILPYYLFLHGDNGESLSADVTMEELTGDLRHAQSNDDPDKLFSGRLKVFHASDEIRTLTSCEHKLLQMHSPCEVPCSLAIRTDNSVQLLACLLYHDDGDETSELKVLLEFKRETFSQYKLLRIGALYIMQHVKEEVKQSLACHKALVTSQKPIWSLSFSSEKVLYQNGSQKSHYLEASSVNNGRECLINLQKNEVSSKLSTSDIHLYIPSEAADLLSGSNGSCENGLSSLFLALEQVLSVSACISMMATASVHVSVLCNSDYRLPVGDLISLNGNIVKIHTVERSSNSCIHLSDDYHMVRIQGTFGPNAYPVAMGPGMNATFYRVLMMGEHKLMLTPVSFVVINSIKEVDIHYYARKCSVPVSDTEILSREFVNTVPSCLIWHLYQRKENWPVQLCCRVVAVHSLVVEHTDKIQNTHLTEWSKMPAIGIPLAGFILDDGSSSCSCWADAENATALLRLNETSSKVFNDSCCSLKWTNINKTLKTTGNLLEKMLNKHQRVTVKKYRKLLDSTSLDLMFSVDSSKELSSHDENLLKFVILNACCGSVLNVVGSKMDSNTMEQLKQVTEIEPILQSMKNVWVKEVRHINPAQEARALIQELVAT
ncbi:CST complex subunit CTC1 isoform X2 [Aristolochia californica]|uniref:CST complex subunit CTC1 isoform X2 n=1 Tax=Aristolochia californica TaxID=171875 RepID=UPI0035DE0CDA